MVSQPASFAFIGLGNMGIGMATNLRKKLPQSTPMVVYDINQAAIDAFIKRTVDIGNVIVAKNCADAAKQVECVITIVPEGSHVKAAYLTPETGILAGCKGKTGMLLIDCSTIDTESSLEVGKAAAAIGVDFADAPVSGGTLGSEKGTLTFMIGAKKESETFQRIETFVKCMGATVFPCGAPSLGLGAKLSNNYLSAILSLGTSEALNLGMRIGLDPKVLSDIFSVSTSSNYINNVSNPVPHICPEAPASHGYAPGFKIQLMRKDITLALKAAKDVNAKIILGDELLAAFSAASEDPRCKDLDSRVIYRWIGGKE